MTLKLDTYLCRYHCSIRTLCNILVEVLGSQWGDADLSVDVTSVSEDEVWVVGHNPAVVDDLSILLSSPPSILWASSSVGRVASFFIYQSLFSEGFRKSFSTDTFLHAGTAGILVSTGTVDHVGEDSIPQGL